MTLSCREDVDEAALRIYDGPINTAVNIHLMSSDSAVVRSEIQAPKQLEFKNGNLEFPEGIDIQFFEKDGRLSSTLRADVGYYIKEDNLYKGEGNVKVNNLIERQRLQSEELFWNPVEKKIYTEKFVTVEDEGKQTLFNGTGMVADENFSKYQIKNVRDSRTLLPGEGL